MEGDIVTLQDAFVFDYSAGVDQHGRFLGKPVPTGIRPRFIDRFEDLGIHVSAGVFGAPAGLQRKGTDVMVLTIGRYPRVAAVVLAGVAVLISAHAHSAAGPPSAVPHGAGLAADPLRRLCSPGVIERFLAKRNFRFFNRETLENAGLRLSQAEFLLLVLIGAFVGALVGLVVAGPLLAILLVDRGAVRGPPCAGLPGRQEAGQVR